MIQVARAQHFESIDLLRGGAAIAVCLYHFTYGFLEPGQWLRVLSHYGYLGVQAFFVISGFVIPYSFAQKGYTWRAFSAFFRKRALRIEPAYWVSIVLMLLMDLSARLNPYNTVPVADHSLWNILLHIPHANALLGQPWIREIYWTLAIDWQFFLLICLLFPLLQRPEWWLRYPFLLLFCVGHGYCGEAWLGYHAFPFAAGMLLFYFQNKHIGKVELYAAWGLLLAATYYQMGITHTLAIGVSIAVIHALRGAWDWLSSIGKISYSVYLTHIFSGWTLCSIAGLFIDSQWMRAIIILLATWASLVFARYFYEKVEAPTQVWAKK